MNDKTHLSIDSNSSPAITVTERAREVALDAMQRRLDPSRPKGNRIPALRIGVQPGGCAGFLYEYSSEFETDKENDEVLQFDGLKVVIDKESKKLLKGSTLDYVDNLKSSGFKIENPNATRTCGCQNSFS
ncbi:MAG: iron-sulfur cluster assembly accessory protein [Candidatus Spechtbacterales bacterium]|nr:iron-sulfur cluster assembly accessory protein [Candidatus Spechtbacterales bacterium]